MNPSLPLRSPVSRPCAYTLDYCFKPSSKSTRASMFSRDRWCASWSLFRATFLVVKMSRFPMRECDDTYVYRIRRIVALVEVLAASRRGFEKRAYCWKRREAYMCEGIGTWVESCLTNRIIFSSETVAIFPIMCGVAMDMSLHSLASWSASRLHSERIEPTCLTHVLSRTQ